MLADALYAMTHGDVEKIAKKLPPNWQHCHDTFDIVCEGFNKWGGTGAPRRLALFNARPFPMYGRDIAVDEAHPLFADAQAIVLEHNAIASAKDELRVKLHALVHSVQTTQKLRDAWPSGKKFIPADPVKSTNLPVPANLAETVNALMQRV